MKEERKEEYISDMEVERMIFQLQLGIDKHYNTCDNCHTDLTYSRCVFCKDVTRMIFAQAGWIQERDRRKHGEKAIRALD